MENGVRVKQPYYFSFTIKLLMIVLLGFILVYAQSLFVPLAFAIILAILLLPVTNFFQHKLYMPRSLAALGCIIISLAIISALIYFFSQQISGFMQDMPLMRERLQLHYETFSHWLSDTFHLNPGAQTKIFENATGDNGDGSKIIGRTVSTLTSVVFNIIMVAIYAFLILYYRETIRKFLYAVFKEDCKEDVTCVLDESKVIIQRYMTGLFIEMAIIAIANTTLLMALGVKYAIFLGILAAVLNIIPYVGILSGIIITCLVTLSTSDSLSQLLWIAIGMEIIHFFDSNFLMPRIVGSRVKINALITIVGVVAGGTLLGLSGIFLALPTIAILKVIFDRVDELKPWGLLMGDDTTPKRSRVVERLERSFVKKPPVLTVENPEKDVL